MNQMLLINNRKNLETLFLPQENKPLQAGMESLQFLSLLINYFQF